MISCYLILIAGIAACVLGLQQAQLSMPLLASSPWRESHLIRGYLILIAGIAACVVGLQQAQLYIKDNPALSGITVFT